MREDRILIVEDDLEWIENYQRWLSHEPLVIDSATSSEAALERLRTTYYTLVILDLSLDPVNPNNRDSIDVQEYLHRHPEGTQHIVSSAHADKEDVRNAAINYKSHYVFFKDEFEDPTKFVEEIRNGIKKGHEKRPDLIQQSYEKMIGDQELYQFEHKILKPLKPKDGAKGYIAFKDKLLEEISPLELHKTRNEVAIVDDQLVFGLYWSRGLGSAISLCITNIKVNDEVRKKAMTIWLGWNPGKLWKKPIQKNNGIGFIHLENNLEPDDFILPTLR